MAGRVHDLLTLLLGTAVGAGVSLAGVYFDIVNIKSDEQRFAVELFDKWQSAMTSAESAEERLAWLNRLDNFIQRGGPTAIKESIRLTQDELTAETRRKEIEKLEAEVKEARRAAQAAAAASQARRDAEQRELEAREAAEQAKAEALQRQIEIETKSLELGYTTDKDGRQRLIP